VSEAVLALGLTALAGLATGLGSLVAFFVRRDNYRFLSVSTGFSAGVMLYISFVGIFVQAEEALVEGYGARLGVWLNVLVFFAGIALIALIDALIPSPENPHQVPTKEETAGLAGRAPLPSSTRLMRMGILAAAAIGIHNFPEGLATFVGALRDLRLGVAIAVAVALHNIPEGISVAVPIYYATGSRAKALGYSFLSGLAEPLGAGLAWVGLKLAYGRAELLPPQVMGFLFAGVAGIMVYISLDELLPASRAYGQGHDSLLGLVGGMAAMALSLLLT